MIIAQIEYLDNRYMKLPPQNQNKVELLLVVGHHQKKHKTIIMMDFTSLFFTALLASVAVNAQRTHVKPTDAPTAAETVPFGRSDMDPYAATEVPDEEEENFIVGGTSVVAGELPFYGHFTGATMCGGALVHEDIFVTAAHCLEDGFPATITVGAVNSADGSGQTVPVCAGLIHPNNNMKAMENDVAILKLCDPVFVNSYAEYNSDPNFPSATGEDLWIVGFGRTNPAGTLSTTLNKAKVDYLNDATCEARYSRYKPEQTICADGPSTGICYGDSGGPLLDSSNKVVGFASFIIDTCASSYPDFFTRISSYAGWLDEQVCTQALKPPVGCSATAQGSGSGGEAGGAAGDGDEDEEENPLTTILDFLLDLFSSFADAMRGFAP